MADSLVEDEFAIRALIERYADAVNRRDASDWASLWTEDGIWDVFGTEIAGRDRVVGAWSAAMKGFSFVFHVAHSAVIEIHGDAARGRWTVSEQLVNTSGQAEGFQLSLVNYARRLTGLQIGLLNINKEGGMVPVFPLFNIGTGSR